MTWQPPTGDARLLASTGPLFTRPLDWMFGVIAEAGYDGVELMVTHAPATQDPDQLRPIMAREGVTVPVVHGPFLLLTRRVFGTDLVGKACRSLDLAGAVGADLMVVHPPYRWQLGFHGWLLGDGDREASRRATRIGVENLYPVSVGGRALRFHRYTRPQHLLSFTHVVFDTSHFGVAGIDIGDAYDVLRDRSVHLHVSDYRGGGRDSHAPLGHGILPLASFLHRVGREGGASITLEIDCRRYLDDRGALVRYLARERAKCLALLDGASAEDVLGRPDRVDPATTTAPSAPARAGLAPPGR